MDRLRHNVFIRVFPVSPSFTPPLQTHKLPPHHNILSPPRLRKKYKSWNRYVCTVMTITYTKDLLHQFSHLTYRKEWRNITCLYDMHPPALDYKQITSLHLKYLKQFRRSFQI